MTFALTLLLVLGAQKPPPTELTLLTISSAFAGAHPCKEGASGGLQFCLERARVVVTMRPVALTAQLEVFDSQSGVRLQSLTVIGGVGVRGDTLYFNAGWKLTSLSLKTPGDKPKVLGGLDCGAEGSPFSFAVANDQPLCARDPEDSDATSVNLDIQSARPKGKGTCAVPPADFQKGDMGYTLVTEHLNGACLRLLGVKLKK